MIMERYRVKLNFTSPIHIGYREGVFNLTETTIHSDTIFSGIINCYHNLFGIAKTNDLVSKFINGEEPFLVSSSFYYIDDEYLLPRPMSISLLDYVKDFKKEKKIKFISEKVLFGKSNNVFIKGEPLLSKDIDKDIYKIEERPRVVIDRITNGTNIYYNSCCRFNEGCGLWFYLDVNEEFKEEIFAAVKLLGDEGIGGERTYGCGQFEASFEKININNKEGKNYLLLSLCIPNNKDNLNDLISYQITERTGYIYSPYITSKRHMLYKVIKEGSILKSKFLGNIIDDTPEGFNAHKVIKYGKAFVIPLGLEG